MRKAKSILKLATTISLIGAATSIFQSFNFLIL